MRLALLRVRVRMRVRVRVVMALVSSLLLRLLLRGGLLHRAHARHLLLLDVLDELRHRHASLLGILSNPLLNLLDLLGSRLLAHESRARHGHSHGHCAWRRPLRRRRSHSYALSWRLLRENKRR